MNEPHIPPRRAPVIVAALGLREPPPPMPVPGDGTKRPGWLGAYNHVVRKGTLDPKLAFKIAMLRSDQILSLVPLRPGVSAPVPRLKAPSRPVKTC